MRSYRHRAAALVAVALLTGCSAKTAGSASAGSFTPPATTSSAAQPSSGTKTPVKRPKKIDLSGLDSCALLSDAQKQRFDLVKTPGTLKSTVYRDTTLCSIGSSDFSYGVSLTAAAKDGVESYEPGVRAGELKAIQVAGFPALTGTSKTLLPTCTIYLDVADGQMVDLGVDGSKIPIEELCARAVPIAEAIIQTISAR